MKSHENSDFLLLKPLHFLRINPLVPYVTNTIVPMHTNATCNRDPK